MLDENVYLFLVRDLLLGFNAGADTGPGEPWSGRSPLKLNCSPLRLKL